MRYQAASLLLLLTFALSPAARAALSDAPHEDIHFLAEHLPESGQDARFLSLPWLGSPLTAGEWQQTVQIGYNDSSAGGFMTLSGPMAALSAGYGVSDRWGIEGLAFYDSMQVGGDRGREVLRGAGLRGVPLDLPEFADFSNPRGDYLHWGAGAALVRELSPAGAARHWSLTAGVLYDHLEMKDFQLDYRVTGGTSAGASGVLDHSGEADFLTPFLGLQQIRPLGTRFSLSPRAIAGAPLPPGDFDTRLTGPGFDLSTTRGDGHPGQIGDAFLGFGLGIQHLRSGLEVELGSMVWYPLFERATHQGVDRSYLVQLAWHHR
ncbi:MAG TPA: hypothetical protein VHU81_19585 [Thermoanaerobaculia bacterium]|nr:hypothetical protein [Thermoanaerobaculia bacterium]